MNKNLPFNKKEIENIIEKYPTPFHLYDERAIRENVRNFNQAFAWSDGFKEFFAVKATPNPYILKILKEEGCGADCSSMAELVLAERVGIKGKNIVFTSNDTPKEDYVKAFELGAIINLDDISHLLFLENALGGKLPDMLSFRYNPGKQRAGGNDIIGKPEEAKYGLTKEQLFLAYKTAQEKGVKSFGLHTMIISNELNAEFFVETAKMLFELVGEIYQKLGIKIELLNFGGGIGIPYRPQEETVNIKYVGEKIKKHYESMILSKNLAPIKLSMECGRVITGPYGYLITRVIHQKHTYKKYIGLDACMVDLMRPALYGAYHHITVLGKENNELEEVYDVTGSLCENNDKFAIDRKLPSIEIGDILVLHDTGAHGHAMGFNYNGKLRSAELLWQKDGEIRLIRRAETLNDYFATLDFKEI